MVKVAGWRYSVSLKLADSGLNLLPDTGVFDFSIGS